MADLAPTNFSETLRVAFQCPQKEIDEFFEHHFLKPLNIQLDSTEVPAETIRHKRQQTNQIKTLLVQFAKK